MCYISISHFLLNTLYIQGTIFRLVCIYNIFDICLSKRILLALIPPICFIHFFLLNVVPFQLYSALGRSAQLPRSERAQQTTSAPIKNTRVSGLLRKLRRTPESHHILSQTLTTTSHPFSSNYSSQMCVLLYLHTKNQGVCGDLLFGSGSD